MRSISPQRLIADCTALRLPPRAAIVDTGTSMVRTANFSTVLGRGGGAPRHLEQVEMAGVDAAVRSGSRKLQQYSADRQALQRKDVLAAVVRPGTARQRSPFTETATGALAAYTSALEVPPSGSLRNRRYVLLSVLAQRTSPSVQARAATPPSRPAGKNQGRVQPPPGSRFPPRRGRAAAGDRAVRARPTRTAAPARPTS